MQAPASSASTSGHALVLKDLFAGYRGVPVVRELNLEVRPGEVVALLGPNGAGKTTTLEAIAGLSGGITWASTRHVSPFGPIEVSWRLSGGLIELDVLVPPGTTASVVLPGEARRDVPPGRHRVDGWSLSM
jgi:energy-coupling factor transporter ATP-binding protein EcfA2